MVVRFANNASSTLASAISPAATLLLVQAADAAEFPTPSGGDYFTLTVVDFSGNLEIMRCTARSGVSLTVVRAQESTAALSFPINSRIDHRLTAGTLTNFAQLVDPIFTGNPQAPTPSAGDNDTSIATTAFVASAVAANGAAAIGDGPPTSPVPGQLWWESDTGMLYVWFIDAGGGAGQWVSATSWAGPPGASAPGDGINDWTEITGKPTTFPPTLPIASSGVTGLDTKQASQDAAIATKEPLLPAGGTTSNFLRGDKTWATTAGSGGVPSDATPEMDGTAAAGVSTEFSRGDHRHPTDASRAAVAHTHAQIDIVGLAAALAAKLDSALYTSADVLAKIKLVDGVGSGLDADLLDGLSSAAFLPSANLTGGKITIAATAPSSPAVNDIWIDTT